MYGFILLKRAVAIVALVWGTASAIYELVSSFHVWSALSLLAAGSAISVFVLFDELDIENPTTISRFFLVAFTLLSFIALFAETDLFNQPRQEATTDIRNGFMNAVIATEPPLNRDESRIAQRGLMDCLLSPNLDAIGAISASVKTLYFGPTLTLFDYVFTETPQRNSNACFSDYQAIKATRPEYFRKVEAKHADYLKSLGQ